MSRRALLTSGYSGPRPRESASRMHVSPYHLSIAPQEVSWVEGTLWRYSVMLSWNNGDQRPGRLSLQVADRKLENAGPKNGKCTGSTVGEIGL